MKISRLYLATVVAPTVASAVYFGFMASDVYISESKFVVRSPERQPSTALGLMVKGTGLARSSDEAYVVQDFMLSRDALDVLEKRLKLKSSVSVGSVDRLSRFAGIDLDDSSEAFYRFYRNKLIDIQTDSSTSVTTLTARAFSSDTARNINQHLLEMGEELVNNMSERRRKDLVAFAEKEVGNAAQRAKDASAKLAEYRNANHLVDPEKEAQLALQRITVLQEDLLKQKAQLAQLGIVSPESPQIEVVQSWINTLSKAILEEKTHITGGNRSLASQAVVYQRLLLDQDVTAKQLAAALAALQQAQTDASRQQLYLERIVQPGSPDVAVEPRRLRNVFTTLIIGLFAWGASKLLLAGIREHKA